jgi:hypothetical protein
MWRFLVVLRAGEIMENGYIITVASAIAVAAIYFLCVRKLGAQSKQPQAARETSTIQ